MPIVPKINILLVGYSPESLRDLEAIVSSLDANLMMISGEGITLEKGVWQNLAAIAIDDRFLPDRSLKLVEQIREQSSCNPELGDRVIPIILITSRSPCDPRLHQACALGWVDCVFQPLIPPLLRTKIEMAIVLARQQSINPQTPSRIETGQELPENSLPEQLYQGNFSSSSQVSEPQRGAIWIGALDAIAIADDTGMYLDANSAACELLGLPLAELLGQHVTDFVESDPTAAQLWQTVLKQGQGMGNCRIRRADGSMREIELTAQANFLPGRHLSIMREIGERKPTPILSVDQKIYEQQATFQKQVEDQLLRIQKAVDSTSDGICITDIGGKSVYHNQAFCRLLEYSPAELEAVGGLPRLFVDEVLGHEVISTIFRGESWNGEVIMRSKSDRKILIFLRADAIQDSEGKIVGFIGIHTNITTRQLEQTAFWESQRLIHQIADTTPTFLYIYDLVRDSNVYCNRETLDFLGMTQAEMQNLGWKYFINFVHPQDQNLIRDHQQKLTTIEDGKVVEAEYRFLKGCQEWRWLHTWEVVFTRTDQGIPEQILGTAIDITERKEALEMQLALAREQEFNQLQLRFFSMISHEFRTPLSSILMSAQILEKSNEEWQNPKIIRNLDRIQASVKHMMHLLEDILAINRIETGQLEFNPRPLMIEDFCRQILAELQIVSHEICGREQRSHVLKFVSEISYPNPCLDAKILEFILENLLMNSLQYSSAGSLIKLTVTCNLNQVILIVQDQGMGIPPESHRQIFEPFYRAPNVLSIPGSGLGLTLVKKCVELCKGEIKFRSHVDSGTTFKVILPLLPLNSESR